MSVKALLMTYWKFSQKIWEELHLKSYIITIIDVIHI
jgi:hypothetical protein